MKKIILALILMMSFGLNVYSEYIRDRIDHDIALLRNDGASEFIVFENDNFFINCTLMKSAATSSGDYTFLIYKLNKKNYIAVYYVERLNRKGKDILGVQVFEGYDPSLFWSFQDTCKVREPQCDKNIMVSDYSYTSITYIIDTNIRKSFYIDGTMNLYCPESPYVKYMNLLSESIKQFLFVSNRFDNNKRFSKKKFYKMFIEDLKRQGCID